MSLPQGRSARGRMASRNQTRPRRAFAKRIANVASRDVDGGQLLVRCCALPCWGGWLGMLSHSDIWQKQLLKNLKNRLRGCWPLRQQAC